MPCYQRFSVVLRSNVGELACLILRALGQGHDLAEVERWWFETEEAAQVAMQRAGPVVLADTNAVLRLICSIPASKCEQNEEGPRGAAFHVFLSSDNLGSATVCRWDVTLAWESGVDNVDVRTGRELISEEGAMVPYTVVADEATHRDNLRIGRPTKRQ